MKLSTILSASTSLVVLAIASGCATSPPPPAVSTTQTTAATAPAPAAPPEEYAVFPAHAEDPNFRPETEKIQIANDAPIEQWTQRYPDASMQLADWAKQYPAAALRLASWEEHHPIGMRTLVDWAVSHRYESIEAFFYGRAAWNELADLAHQERDAVNELLDWVRRSPHAAEELAIHEQALTWLSAHPAKGREAKMRHHVPMAAHSVAGAGAE